MPRRTSSADPCTCMSGLFVTSARRYPSVHKRRAELVLCATVPGPRRRTCCCDGGGRGGGGEERRWCSSIREAILYPMA